jgi:molybdopterin molybdotransferase
MILLEEAQQLILHYARSFGVENSLLTEGKGRVLAEDIFADRSYPPFHRAAMDGYAIRGDDMIVEGVREFQVIQEIHAGDDVQISSVIKGDSVKIMTGAATPECFDTIIRVEDSVAISKELVRFTTDSIKKGQNIAKKGEDINVSELILPKGTFVNGPELGVMAAVGKASFAAKKYPQIAILSTGNEVKSLFETILPYQIRDSNRYALEGFLLNYGCRASLVQLLRDSKEDIKRGLDNAIEMDIVIISGGVSAGDADFVPSLLKSAGYVALFHKVMIKPGKPFWFGVKGKTVVFALPGNPMSCQVGFKLFIEPFLRKSFGLNPYPVFKFQINEHRKKRVKLDEFFPCKIVDNQLIEIKTNGSGDIRTSIGSDGLARHPIDGSDFEKGQLVDFFFW